MIDNIIVNIIAVLCSLVLISSSLWCLIFLIITEHSLHAVAHEWEVWPLKHLKDFKIPFLCSYFWGLMSRLIFFPNCKSVRNCETYICKSAILYYCFLLVWLIVSNNFVVWYSFLLYSIPVKSSWFKFTFLSILE